ncbi:unnamed protein product [Rotaria sordida]|uniref:Uncharacterized protein n=1 Tax=Rotaria sordida TaxID=392033 RepID=A0A814LCZ8_9BILA|nr:unnamed protein product [Rotaria sordida]
MNDHLYAKFIKEVGHPEIQKVCGRDLIFQDDADSEQRTKIVLRTGDKLSNDRILPEADETCDFIGKGPLDDQPFKHKASDISEQTVNDVYQDIQESISKPNTDIIVNYIQRIQDQHSSLSPLPPPPPPSRLPSRSPLPSAPSGQSPPPPPLPVPAPIMPPPSPTPSRGSVELAHTTTCCACLFRRPQQNQHRVLVSVTDGLPNRGNSHQIQL